MESKHLSESLLGPEKQIFAETMELIARYLHDAVGTDRVDDLPTKRKVQVGTFGFNLLWTAWTEALAGRYDAASHLRRSIGEAPLYLWAIDSNPHLADEIGRRQIKVETIRRQIKKDLANLPGYAARSWIQEEGKNDQPYSHVTVDAMNMALAVAIEDERKVATLRPGGAVSVLILRPLALELSSCALMLLGVLPLAFRHVDAVLNHWDQRGRQFVEQASAQVQKELDTLRTAPGEVEGIFVPPIDGEVSEE